MKTFSTARFRNRILNSYLTVFLFFGVSIPCLSQVDFAPFVTYPTGSVATAVCIGDLNNDGLNDIALCTKYADSEDDSLDIYLQNIHGNLESPVKYPYPERLGGKSSLAINDVNNDGLNDVVLGYSDSLAIFLQNAGGTLTPAQLYYGGVADYISGISIGDLNNDQLNDIALSFWLGNHISILYQTPLPGEFITDTHPAPPSSGYNQIEVADMNNDTLNDVVLMIGQLQGGIHVYTQDNAGALNDYITYDIPHPQGCQGGFGIGDLNNDGLNDIAKNKWGEIPDAQIALLFQDGLTGALQDPVLIPAGNAPKVVKIADMDCDGLNEIIVVHSGSRLSVFSQDTHGVYNDYSQFTIASSTEIESTNVSVGDFNNDGLYDIAFANKNYGLITLKNKSLFNSSLIRPVTPTENQAVCHDDMVVIYKINRLPAEQVSWNIIPPQSGSIIYANNDSCEIAWNNDWRGQAGIYGVVVNRCYTAFSDTFFVNIDRLPELNLGNDTALCAGNTFELHVSSRFDSYKWQDNSHDPDFTITGGGIYFVEATHVCGTQYDTIGIEEVPLPVVNLTQDTILCYGSTLQLDVSLQGNYNYRWQDNAAGPLYAVDSPGNYTVEITDQYQCQNSASVTVQELHAPFLSWPSDTTICLSHTLTLQAGNPASHYKWQDGSDLPNYTVTASGSYSVEVTNACGSAQASVTVNVEECPYFLDVPSAFSPNGDGVNDIIYAVGLNVEKVHFMIYNRWGQRVFESHSLDHGWDGTFGDEGLNEGVFMYTITARSVSNGLLLEKKGNITLIR